MARLFIQRSALRLCGPLVSCFVGLSVLSGCSSSDSSGSEPLSSNASSSLSSTSSTSSTFTASSSSSNTRSSSNSNSSNSSSSQANAMLIEQGLALFTSKGCTGCHGNDGNGTNKIYVQNWSRLTLTTKIRDTMPLGSPQNCEQECAEAIAAYIQSWVNPTACDSTEDLLPRRMRLLTPREYQLTINELFGLNQWNDWARSLPRTEPIRGYDNNVPDIQVSFAHATQYWEVATTVSANVRLSSVTNCTALSQNQCATKMMDEFGPKIFRRPLDQAERNLYIELFNTAQSHDAGVRLVLKSMLISPNFLYRSETGEPDGEGGYRLTPYEIASLLSYTFWGSMPDTELFTLAQDGSLSEGSVILAQAKRLMDDDRAKDQLAYFAKQWLTSTSIGNIFKNQGTFPKFNWDMAQALNTEFELFFADAFLNGTSRFSDLFLADYVFVNERLASLYDLAGVSGANFRKVNAGPHRGGLLHLGGILATHAKMDQTSPILRGVFVRERLMCQEFPPPPANAGGVIPLNPNLSTRERFSAHTDNDGCRGCHEKIDPIGFSFERYDGAGQYREIEGNNLAVDDSGSVTGLVLMSDTDFHPYKGTKGLSTILAHADSAAACLADQFHSYWQGLAEPNECVVEDVVSRWRAKDYTLRDLWLESVKSPSFTQRR